jgi:mono/diheme cytochrome c family protein
MSFRTFLGGCVISAAAVAGCYTGGDVTSTTVGGAPAPVTSVSATDPSAVTGVPCDVARVLATSCAGCHGPTPTGGAPNAMMTYDDLMATSMTAPASTIAEVSLARMKDATSPMPPEGASAADLAILEVWIAAGMPAGTEACDAVPPATDLYGTPSVCTSGTKWTRGNHGSKSMKPGAACNDCHRFSAAGTVYATAHEPDDCNGGASSTIQVVITGADGKVTKLPVNSAGNFSWSSTIKMPYKAKVVSGTKSRAMSGAQTDGDCNKCHTENGTEKAPGRVMAP